MRFSDIITTFVSHNLILFTSLVWSILFEEIIPTYHFTETWCIDVGFKFCVNFAMFLANLLIRTFFRIPPFHSFSQCIWKKCISVPKMNGNQLWFGCCFCFDTSVIFASILDSVIFSLPYLPANNLRRTSGKLIASLWTQPSIFLQ